LSVVLGIIWRTISELFGVIRLAAQQRVRPSSTKEDCVPFWERLGTPARFATQRWGSKINERLASADDSVALAIAKSGSGQAAIAPNKIARPFTS
jgi:hypothetical protein